MWGAEKGEEEEEEKDVGMYIGETIAGIIIIIESGSGV